MKQYLRTHFEIILFVIAGTLLIVLAGFFYQMTNLVFSEVTSAIASVPPQNGGGFNLDDAATINFRGLLDNASSTGAPSSTSAVPLPPPAPVFSGTSSAAGLQ